MEDDLLRDAREVEESVRFVYGMLRRPFDADISQSGLTIPQLRVMEELTRSDGGGGLSLKELSGRIGLSHSTVSGILDRLEKRGFVQRTPDGRDRRRSVIRLTEEVADYLREMSPSRSLGSIPEALSLAGDEERRKIIEGLRALRGLFGDISARRETEDGR